MRRLVRWAIAGVLYFSVATLIAEVVIAGYVARAWKIDRATSTVDCSSDRNASSEPIRPAAAAARRSESSATCGTYSASSRFAAVR